MKQIVAFDTETFPFGPYQKAPELVCVSWCTEGRTGLITGFNDATEWLEECLDKVIAGKMLMVGVNTGYDMAVLMNVCPRLWGKIFAAYAADGIICAAINEKLLDNALGEFPFYVDSATGKNRKSDYSLAGIAKKRLGREVAKGSDTWRLRYRELHGVPIEQWPKEAVNYALDDAEITYQIAMNQFGRMTGAGLPTQYMEARADFALSLMSAWGVTPDIDHVQKLWDETADKMDVLANKLKTTGLVNYTGSPEYDPAGLLPLPTLSKKTAAIREAVASHFPGGQAPRTKPSSKHPYGQIKTGEDVIDLCDDPNLRKMVEYAKLEKVANTYLRKFFDPVIHASFWGFGGATSRTSCSGPNLQNQSKMPGVRESLVARPGMVYAACDFDSQEMRTLAQSCLDICGKSKLAERYQADRHFDPHLEFAAQLMKISVAEARQRLGSKDPHVKKMRQQAKIANFGYPGGMKPPTFVSYARGWGLDLTLQQSQDLYDAWLMQWPEMDPYFRHVKSLLGHGGFGTQVYPQSGFVRGGVGYTNACNGYFQGLAAHASKESLFEICRRCYSNRTSYLYGSRPVLFVHDENILETPEFAGHEAVKEMSEVMVAAQEKWTPQVPAAAGGVLMRRWSKSAEPTFINGRLVPWEG